MKKINPWPFGIAIFLLSFVGVVITAGILISREHYDLVRQDYYDHEITYEDHLEQLRRASTLPQKPTLHVHEHAHQITLQFPPLMLNQLNTVRLDLYCPADKTQDLHLIVELDDEGRQNIQLPTTAQGNWKASLQ